MQYNIVSIFIYTLFFVVILNLGLSQDLPQNSTFRHLSQKSDSQVLVDQFRKDTSQLLHESNFFVSDDTNFVQQQVLVAQAYGDLHMVAFQTRLILVDYRGGNTVIKSTFNIEDENEIRYATWIKNKNLIIINFMSYSMTLLQVNYEEGTFKILPNNDQLSQVTSLCEKIAAIIYNKHIDRIAMECIDGLGTFAVTFNYQLIDITDLNNIVVEDTHSFSTRFMGQSRNLNQFNNKNGMGFVQNIGGTIYSISQRRFFSIENNFLATYSQDMILMAKSNKVLVITGKAFSSNYYFIRYVDISVQKSKYNMMDFRDDQQLTGFEYMTVPIINVANNENVLWLYKKQFSEIYLYDTSNLPVIQQTYSFKYISNQIATDSTFQIALQDDKEIIYQQLNGDLYAYQISFPCKKYPDLRLQPQSIQSVFTNGYTMQLTEGGAFTQDDQLFFIFEFQVGSGGIQKMDSSSIKDMKFLATYSNDVSPNSFFYCLKTLVSHNSQTLYQLGQLGDHSNQKIGFVIWDIGTDTQKSYFVIDREQSPNTVIESDISDNLLFVNYQNGDFYIFDVSDKTTPTQINMFLTDEKPTKTLAININANVVISYNFKQQESQNLLKIIDITQLLVDGSISEVGQFSFDKSVAECIEMKKSQNTLICSFVDGGISILDISDFGNIKVISNTQGYIQEMGDTENYIKKLMLSVNELILYVRLIDNHNMIQYDISNLKNPLLVQTYTITDDSISVLHAHKSDIILDIFQAEIRFYSYNNYQDSLYIEHDKISLGNSYKLLTYPMKVVDDKQYLCQNTIDVDFKIVEFNQFNYTVNLQQEITDLPNAYEKYNEQFFIQANPRSQELLGKQLINILLSKKIQDNIFEGLVLNGTPLTIDDSTDILLSLIKSGYIDIDGFTTSQFDFGNKLRLESKYNPIELQIRTLINSVTMQMYTEIEVVGSLEMENNLDRLQFTTPSTLQITLSIQIDDDSDSIFMDNIVYPNVITSYSSNKKGIFMTGTQEKLNENLLIIRANSNQESFQGVFQANDGINEPFSKVIPNLQSMLQINKAPKLTNSSMQAQFNEQIKPQVDQELFFTPKIQYFMDEDEGDQLQFLVEYASYEQPKNQTEQQSELLLESISQQELDWKNIDDSWINFNERSFSFKGIPTDVDYFYFIRVQAFDGYKYSEADTFNINLYDSKPYFPIKLSTQFKQYEVVIEQAIEFQILAADDDDNQEKLEYLIEKIEEDDGYGYKKINENQFWGQLQKNTGIFSLNAPIENIGYKYTIHIKVSDIHKFSIDKFSFTVKNTLWNQVLQIIYVASVVLSVLGVFKFRDELYNICCKKYYRFPKETIKIGQNYKKVIPLVYQAQIEANLLYTNIMKNSQKKGCKKWIDKYMDKSQNEPQFLEQQFKQVVKECYLKHISNKMGEDFGELTELDKHQLDDLTSNIAFFLGQQNYPYEDVQNGNGADSIVEDQPTKSHLKLDIVNQKFQNIEKSRPSPTPHTGQSQFQQYQIDRSEYAKQPSSQQIQQYVRSSSQHHLQQQQQNIQSPGLNIQIQDQSSIDISSSNAKDSPMKRQASGKQWKKLVDVIKFKNAAKSQQQLANSLSVDYKDKTHGILGKKDHSQMKSKRIRGQSITHGRQKQVYTLIMFLKYMMIQNISQGSLANIIVKKLKNKAQKIAEIKDTQGWLTQYINEDEEIIQDNFETDFEEIFNQYKQKFEKNRSRYGKIFYLPEIVVKQQCYLILFAFANGIGFPRNPIAKAISQVMVPSIGLVLKTTYSKVKSVVVVQFNETSPIVKYCRGLAGMFLIEQHNYPNSNAMPSWLTQDVDIKSNSIILEGTPTVEDKYEVHTLRITNVNGYIIRQFQIEIVPDDREDQTQEVNNNQLFDQDKLIKEKKSDDEESNNEEATIQDNLQSSKRLEEDFENQRTEAFRNETKVGETMGNGIQQEIQQEISQRDQELQSQKSITSIVDEKLGGGVQELKQSMQPMGEGSFLKNFLGMNRSNEFKAGNNEFNFTNNYTDHVMYNDGLDGQDPKSVNNSMHDMPSQQRFLKKDKQAETVNGDY